MSCLFLQETAQQPLKNPKSLAEFELLVSRQVCQVYKHTIKAVTDSPCVPGAVSPSTVRSRSRPEQVLELNRQPKFSVGPNRWSRRAAQVGWVTPRQGWESTGGWPRHPEGCAGNASLNSAGRSAQSPGRCQTPWPTNSGTMSRFRWRGPGRAPRRLQHRGRLPATPAEPTPATHPGQRSAHWQLGRPTRRDRCPATTATASLPRPARTCSPGPPLCLRSPA